MKEQIDQFFGNIGSGAATGWVTLIAGLGGLFAILWTSFPTVETGQIGVRKLIGRVWIRRWSPTPVKLLWVIPATRYTRWGWDFYCVLGFLPVWFWRMGGHVLKPPYPYETGPGIKFAPFGIAAMAIVSSQPRTMDMGAFDVDVRLPDGVQQWRVDAKIIWFVPRRRGMPTRSVVRGQNGLDAQVQALCSEAIRATYSAGDLSAEQLRDADVVYANMLPRVEQSLRRYGVVLTRVILNNTARSFGQMVTGVGANKVAAVTAH